MEVVNLYKIGSEQFTRFHVTSRQPIGDLNDWGEKLQRVKGFCNCRGTDIPLSFVSKAPRYMSSFKYMDHLDPVADYCNTWNSLREAGILVVPILRKVSTTEVMMTDLCLGDGCLYDKFAATTQGQHDRQPMPIDSVFIQLNFQEIERAAKSIFDRATKAGITLAYDDPLNLVVYPNGNWHLFNTRYR